MPSTSAAVDSTVESVTESAFPNTTTDANDPGRYLNTTSTLDSTVESVTDGDLVNTTTDHSYFNTTSTTTTTVATTEAELVLNTSVVYKAYWVVTGTSAAVCDCVIWHT